VHVAGMVGELRVFGWLILESGAEEMSDKRSWDGKVRDISSIYCGDDTRVVIWPEGAPKQKDVPQAGESVRRTNTGENRKTFVVATGIPYTYQDGQWYLRVYTSVENPDTIALQVRHLERIPPTPPQTYTEDEVRTAVSSLSSIFESNVDLILKRLRRGS